MMSSVSAYIQVCIGMRLMIMRLQAPQSLLLVSDKPGMTPTRYELKKQNKKITSLVWWCYFMKTAAHPNLSALTKLPSS